MRTDTVESEWLKGFPRKKGYYKCLVNGEELELYHFICVMNGQHKWYLNKKEEVKDEVLWKKP